MITTYQTYQTHPAAELFPMMEEQQIKEMADDIRLNGLREPITMCEGKVLDGRNRLKACERAVVEPSFVELTPGESPAAFVWSKNYARRHLTISQRSMAAIKMQTMTAKESKERMVRGGTLAVRQGVEIIPQAEKGRTRDKIAEIVDVNPRYISEAMTIQKQSPELAAEVLAGNVTIPEAKRRLKDENAEEGEAKMADIQSFDATLLVVDLVIGSEDRIRRKDILHDVVLAAFKAKTCDAPSIIMVREHYREGAVQYCPPQYVSCSELKGWNSLEGNTRVTGCHTFPLRCKRVKHISAVSDKGLESLAYSATTHTNNAIRDFRTADESSHSPDTFDMSYDSAASADGLRGQQDGELIPPPANSCSKSG